MEAKAIEMTIKPTAEQKKRLRSFIGAVGGNVDVDFMDENYNTAHAASYEGVSPARVLSGITSFYDEGIKPKGNVSYSIAGVRGAANIDAMEEATTRLDNLAVAREMESLGKDAKDIRIATGWERGADGLWRYEILDVTLKDANAWIEKRNIKLADVVDGADELFAAYPEFKDIKVAVRKDWGYVGAYIDEDKIIKLSIGDLRDILKRFEFEAGRAVELSGYALGLKNDINHWMNHIRETIVHEIQHAIQHKEGFAEGGNSRMVLNDSRKQLEELWDAWKERALDYNSKPKSWRLGLVGQSVRAEIMAEKRRLNALQRKNSIGSEGYHKLAGEVESRNVERRMRLTPEERRATLLSETEDVAREDQIFLRENLGESHMGSRVTKRMADIATLLSDKELTPEQQKVVDVYTGKSKSETIIVKRIDGEQSVIVRQGNEMGAGTKHSVYRHYGTQSGYITAEDILLIPKVLIEGEKSQGSKPNTYKYELVLEDGDALIVTTQRDGRTNEMFTNAYTNRKASNSILSRETAEVSNTPNGAQVSNYDAYSADKDTTTNPKDQISEQESNSLSRERADIESKAKADGTWLKAPNGEDTNLSPEQWVTVRTKAFKEWFGDWENDPENASKVVDENGEPKVVWHGGTFAMSNFTPKGFMHFGTKRASLDIIVFNEIGADNLVVEQNENLQYEWEYKDEYDEENDITRGEHPFKTETEAYEDAVRTLTKDYIVVAPYFLNLRDIKRVKDTPNWASEVAKAKEQSYDGLAYKNLYEDMGSESYVAFSPNQIKSATENIGTFDSANDDIRYSLNRDDVTIATPEMEAEANEELSKEAKLLAELDEAQTPPLTCRGYRFRYPSLCERSSVSLLYAGYRFRYLCLPERQSMSFPLCWVSFSIPRFEKPLREQSLNGVPPIR